MQLSSVAHGLGRIDSSRSQRQACAVDPASQSVPSTVQRSNSSLYCFCMHACMCAGARLRVTEYVWSQRTALWKLVLFLPPCGFQGSYSGHPTWQKAAVSTESSQQPKDPLLLFTSVSTGNIICWPSMVCFL